MSFSPFQTKVPKYRPSLAIDEILAAIDALNFHLASGQANQATHKALHTLNMFAYKQSINLVVPTNGNTAAPTTAIVPTVFPAIPTESYQDKAAREAQELADLQVSLMNELGNGKPLAQLQGKLQGEQSIESIGSLDPAEL